MLDELFKALLHNLMTGAIRVADLDLSALGATPSAMFGVDSGIHGEGPAAAHTTRPDARIEKQRGGVAAL